MTLRNHPIALLTLCASALLSGASMAAEGAAATQAAAPAPYVMPAGTPDYIRKAVASKDRPEAMSSRDANRKPAELLALSGVKPGDQVLEFASFGQYFTTLLSDIVGPQGKVYMLDLPYTEARSGAASRTFAAAHPNTQYTLADYNSAELPQNLDLVFNVLYYHDLPLNKIDTAALNAKILKALKPGGVFFVVDHNAAPGSGTRDTEKLHRIDPEVIKKEVLAAGFELVEQSKLLAHAPDDHTQMVFAPGLRGLTDQSVFKFRKPLKAK
ncbi:MAG: methyltransferase [Steroidobacteraceae bacterium]